MGELGEGFLAFRMCGGLCRHRGNSGEPCVRAEGWRHPNETEPEQLYPPPPCRCPPPSTLRSFWSGSHRPSGPTIKEQLEATLFIQSSSRAEEEGGGQPPRIA